MLFLNSLCNPPPALIIFAGLTPNAYAPPIGGKGVGGGGCKAYAPPVYSLHVRPPAYALKCVSAPRVGPPMYAPARSSLRKLPPPPLPRYPVGVRGAAGGDVRRTPIPFTASMYAPKMRTPPTAPLCTPPPCVRSMYAPPRTHL